MVGPIKSARTTKRNDRDHVASERDGDTAPRLSASETENRNYRERERETWRPRTRDIKAIASSTHSIRAYVYAHEKHIHMLSHSRDSLFSPTPFNLSPGLSIGRLSLSLVLRVSLQLHITRYIVTSLYRRHARMTRCYIEICNPIESILWTECKRVNAFSRTHLLFSLCFFSFLWLSMTRRRRRRWRQGGRKRP